MQHPFEELKSRELKKDKISTIEPLLTQILDSGKLVYEFPSIQQIRDTKEKDLSNLDSGVKRFINPHRYHVSLSPKLFELKKRLILEMKE